MCDSVTLPLTPEDLVLPGPSAPIQEGHKHYSQRATWIRAAVLGASDGLVTVGAMMTGVGAANKDQRTLLLSAVSASIAGALSMAVGEFVSVDQQADTEKADVEKERFAQQAGPEIQAAELEELTRIYEDRGLDRELAEEVAKQLTIKDAVRAHARDELNIDVDEHPSPYKAALSSAVAFTLGAAVPTLTLLLPTPSARYWGLIVAVICCLIVFGATSALLGGASMTKGAIRLLLGGVVAMLLTTAVGHLFHA